MVFRAFLRLTGKLFTVNGSESWTRQKEPASVNSYKQYKVWNRGSIFFALELFEKKQGQLHFVFVEHFPSPLDGAIAATPHFLTHLDSMKE
jgi:hypothetical protein